MFIQVGFPFKVNYFQNKKVSYVPLMLNSFRSWRLDHKQDGLAFSAQMYVFL